MSMTVTARIGKLNTVESVEWDTLPETSKAYLAQYGFTQCLNDAHASIIKKNYSGPDAEANFVKDVSERVAAKLKAIEDGTLRAVTNAPVTDQVAIAHLAKSMGLTPDQVLKAIENQAKKRA